MVGCFCHSEHKQRKIAFELLGKSRTNRNARPLLSVIHVDKWCKTDLHINFISDFGPLLMLRDKKEINKQLVFTLNVVFQLARREGSRSQLSFISFVILSLC